MVATVGGTGESNGDARVASEPDGAEGTTDDPIASRIGEWQTRLLQLNRRNNLLYFKPGRSAVGITGVGPDELHDRLRRSRRGLEFPYAPPPRRRSRFARDDEPEEEPDAPVASRADLATDCDVVDLQRRLRNLRRKDREWEEEQGLNVLFLAAGFLDWIDADGERARSPLVLIPCDLERASPRDPFRLRAEDDDPVVNPTLRHQLSVLGVDLPALGGDSSEDESIDAYVAAVGDLVGSRGDWSVDAAIALGAFSYSKLAMYQDLERMLRQGVRSDLTQLLAAGGAAHSERATASDAASATPRSEDLAGGRLDDLLDIRDQYAVLPADFSQLGALDQARQGGHLVIHGPPGTGKSQTIANLIATLLADGKRVLFVSEKTAALDVVKRRLEECGLGVFCFDLHSDRGRKSEVYAQLRESVNNPRARIAAGVSADDLKEQRDRLNRVVRRLHGRRQPLGLSVYEVQGRFARLRHLPRFEALETPSVGDLEQEWMRQADADAGRVARRPTEFLSHDASPWMPLRMPQRSLQLADLIRSDMADAQLAVEELRASAKPHSEWLGVQAIGSAEDARALARLLQLLAEAPAVPGAWVERGAVPRLRRLSREQAEQQRERRRLEEVLSDALGTEPPSIDYRAVLARIPLSPGDQEAIEATAGRGWRSALGTDPAALLDEASELAAALDRLTASAAVIADSLGDPELRTLGRIDHAARLAQHILRLDPVPQHWLRATTIDELEQEVAQARSLLDQLTSEEDALRADFSAGLVELVDEEMLVRYRTDHQSFWQRLFRGEYRRDQRVLRGQLAAPRKLSPVESVAAVERALDVKRLRARWSEIEEGLGETLGARLRGRATQWASVGEDLQVLRGVLTDWRGEASILRELTAAGTDGERRRALELATEPLSAALARYRRAVESVGHEPLGDGQLNVAATGETARRALEPLHRVRDATAELFRSLAKPLADFHALTGLVESGVRLMAIGDEDERLAAALASDFGALFGHETTDWAAVSRALDWTEEFLDAANGRVGDTLRHHANEPQRDGEYAARADAVVESVGRHVDALRVLDQRFDVAATDWPSWDAPPLADLAAWATRLRDNAGDAQSWVEYRDAVRGFNERFGDGAATAVRSLTDSAADVPGIVARRVYEAWLDEVYAAEPELGEFNRVDHEGVRARFRELDEQFPTAARQRVRELAFGRYPEQHATPLQAGQLGLLTGELSKRRRQMSVRRLIARVPTVLQAMKPCFLMSPLAVSQYLPFGPLESDHLAFDVVIFDEASQVLPEDAIPAIERARQVIVVGDRLQLPPTTFFQGGVGDDDDNLDDDDDTPADAFEGRESILDVMVGQVGPGIAERYLSVHYRSRCESLIRFSNHAFYDNRLLTFPGPDPGAPCVRDVYLPDATYDAGGTRQNRREAERVADIVFELMETLPDGDSVGVVALSRAQADLIENLIEQGRLIRRHLDERFGEDVRERFFVKNLENVQGDERDHMILSIGYGRTPAGAAPNRFGPINNEGGERRLNVAVTRARKSMTVVHALRPEDITSTTPGAQQLRRYLEYARNPLTALDANVTGTGEPESPFEEAVLAALRGRGHRVEAQVGVSGYRIDLAILSQDGGGYDLGVECDGATYHRSPAARDRDWLRQQVLEDLGWRIHRVWSTAWIRDQESEIAAIEEALELARAGVPAEPRPPPEGDAASDVPEVADTAPGAATLSQAYPAAEAETIDGAPPVGTEPFFDDYRRTYGQLWDGAPLDIPLGALAARVRHLVEVEQPVHIDAVVDGLRIVLGVGRVGTRIRAHIQRAILSAITDGVLSRDGEFLQVADEAGTAARPRHDPDRPIGRVADSELDAGLLLVARRTFGASQPDLVRETARQFGWRRTGPDIRDRLNERLDSLLESGRLRQRGDTLVAPK